MLLRLLCMIALAAAFGGCASTQMKSENEQLASRVTDLEKNQQAKDAEIVDLQYQVKDLSSKLESNKSDDSADQASAGQPPASGEQTEETKGLESAGASQIVRVKASPETIQRALKAAGVYTGPIDGKIGPGTKSAIIEFQKNHDLKADGVLGRKTWEALKAYLK